MEFQEAYLKAMQEQAPKLLRDLQRHGRVNQHLHDKTKEAFALRRRLLSQHRNPGPAERAAAEEQVFHQLIDFPPEKNDPAMSEPPFDLPMPNAGEGRKPGEYQTLLSRVKTTS